MMYLFKALFLKLLPSKETFVGIDKANNDDYSAEVTIKKVENVYYIQGVRFYEHD